jgi:predicted alpha/beta superfamily hydrolase
MVEKFEITIPELTGEEKTRRVYIYLPESYAAEPERRYPVLYMFDGHNVFFDEDATYGKSWGMKDYMDYTNTQLIIAAVECNDSPDNGRLREYSPYSFRAKGFGYIEGLGKITMDWWVNTFKPQVDENYRTLPERETTFIAGSSMGGLMSLYALLEYNQYFSRAAALSPSLWTNRKKVMDLIRSASVDPNTLLYMDYGDLEFGNHDNMRAGFAQAAAALIGRGIKVDIRVVPEGTHCEASWERQLPYFMNTLLYGFEDVPYEDEIGAGWEEDSWDEETENPDEEFEDWE